MCVACRSPRKVETNPKSAAIHPRLAFLIPAINPNKKPGMPANNAIDPQNILAS